jgi:hypothetical protein
MIRTFCIVVFMLAQTAVGATAATCSGANPAITSVAVKNVTSNGGLNYYHIAGTVTNLGTQSQPSNTLQFVDIWQYGNRLDDRGIPALAAGQSYNFGYVWQRNPEAARGSTSLTFRIRMAQGSDCNPGNGTYNLTL